MAPFCFPDHQPLELGDRGEVGVGSEVDLDQRPLGLAKGRQVVVGRQGLAHLHRADMVGGHGVGLEPDAHGEGAGAEDVGPLHPLEGRQARLDHPHQVVGDLVLLEQVGGETEVG